jgi:hypothetical protein
MPVAALTSHRQVGARVRAYAGVVAKPLILISVGYCVLSNISFQSSCDGSLTMHSAANAGLVTEGYAVQHAEDVVLFKRVGPQFFEYRIKRPILGYAGIPWLVARRTNIDLLDQCQALGNSGCKVHAD